MKSIIILGDGMADTPIAALGGKTPLMAANTPHMDKLATLGKNGMLSTVPLDMPPGSEVANLAVLGYDVREVYSGRGVLEAAAIGIDVQPEDLVMRCNLICVNDGVIKNHSAGHISTEEAAILIEALNAAFADERIRFYPGVSYRHIMILKHGSADVRLTPPHDVPGTAFRDVFPFAAEYKGISNPPGETSAILQDIILRSQELLKDHPVNQQRIAAGKDPANSVWFWSAGTKPRMKTYQELYGKSGAVISAVDLLHGIGVYAGFRILRVEGATGLYNTNYEGKVQAALDAIREVDMVYLHIEAADEAGHEGDVELKIKCIEAIDSRVLKPVLEFAQNSGEEIAVALLPDHPTPCAIRTHTHEPIPFVIYKPGNTPDDVTRYDEVSALDGAYGSIANGEFIRELFGPVS